MDKIKACITKSLAKQEPSDAEIAAAVVEALDIVGSIADSLKRIADAQEKIADCVQNCMDGSKAFVTR